MSKWKAKSSCLNWRGRGITLGRICSRWGWFKTNGILSWCLYIHLRFRWFENDWYQTSLSARVTQPLTFWNWEFTQSIPCTYTTLLSIFFSSLWMCHPATLHHGHISYVPVFCWLISHALYVSLVPLSAFLLRPSELGTVWHCCLTRCSNCSYEWVKLIVTQCDRLKHFESSCAFLLSTTV